MTGYDAVLFDSDGILVDPPEYDTKVAATRAAFAEVGVEDASQEQIDDIVTGTTTERLREICADHDVEVETFWEARERLDEQSQLEQFEAGARTRYDDVTSISAVSQTCGVVSNNHHSTIRFVLDFFDFESMFDTYYGREMTAESLKLKKPNTHYLDRARADLDAESVLYVGDSESDVIAARRAGMDSAFVRRPHCEHVDLSVTPTYELRSLHDMADIVEDGTN